jgi:nitrogen fixation NifU-like protein
MMTQLVKGKQVDEVQSLGARFREMVMGDQSAVDDSSLGSLRALSGVARFPARVKCALLAWNALETAIEAKRGS